MQHVGVLVIDIAKGRGHNIGLAVLFDVRQLNTGSCDSRTRIALAEDITEVLVFFVVATPGPLLPRPTDSANIAFFLGLVAVNLPFSICIEAADRDDSIGKNCVAGSWRICKPDADQLLTGYVIQLDDWAKFSANRDAADVGRQVADTLLSNNHVSFLTFRRYRPIRLLHFLLDRMR